LQALLLPIISAEMQHRKRVGDDKKTLIAVERDIGARDSCGAYLISFMNVFSHAVTDSCETSLFWHVSKCMTCGTELCAPCLRDLAETSNSGVNPLAFTLPDAAVARLATCVPHVQGSNRPVMHAASAFRPITRFRLEELQQASEDLRSVETDAQVKARSKARVDAKTDAQAEVKAKAAIAAMAELTAEVTAEAKVQAKAAAKAEIEAAARAKAKSKVMARATAKATAKAEAMGEAGLNANPGTKFETGLDDPPSSKAYLYQVPQKALSRGPFTFKLGEKKNASYGPFRKQWAAGRPMIVSNIQLRCSPARILSESKQQRCRIVDCETGDERRGNLAEFFKDFNGLGGRLEKVKVRSIGLLPSSRVY
jgi:hypothetical protein